MTNRQSDREGHVYECDHMRQIVKVGDAWHHLDSDGKVVATPCGARSIYRVNATFSGDHTTGSWAGPR